MVSRVQSWECGTERGNREGFESNTLGNHGGERCSGQPNSEDVHAVAANELRSQEKPRVPVAQTWSRSPLRGAQSKF